jgi:hypothetical protein
MRGPSFLLLFRLQSRRMQVRRVPWNSTERAVNIPAIVILISG